MPRTRPQAPKPTSAPSADLESNVGYMLRRAQLAVFADFVACQSAPRTRPGQYAVLLLIARHPGLSQSALCDQLSIKRANLVPLLNEMKQRGLAIRRPSLADRRSNCLYLLPAGEKLVARVLKAERVHERRIVRLLGTQRQQQLLTMLEQLSHL